MTCEMMTGRDERRESHDASTKDVTVTMITAPSDQTVQSGARGRERGTGTGTGKEKDQKENDQNAKEQSAKELKESDQTARGQNASEATESKETGPREQKARNLTEMRGQKSETPAIKLLLGSVSLPPRWVLALWQAI